VNVDVPCEDGQTPIYDHRDKREEIKVERNVEDAIRFVEDLGTFVRPLSPRYFQWSKFAYLISFV
jgi:hypothetical protein